MDLQEYLDKVLGDRRAKTLAESDQLTLGDMISKLKPIVDKQATRIMEDRNEATVVYDFVYMFPTSIDSWRGIYAELALDYESAGEAMKVSMFYKMLCEAVGKTYTGYKGGEFTMTNNTPVWVANNGEAGSTAVVDIVDNEYEVIIMTGYRKSFT